MTILGSVDMVTTKGATGWAYAQGRRNDIVVQAVLSHEVIGDAVATDHRPDLAAVGMGKGNCGYNIEFYREIDPLYLPFVSVKIDGGDAELPRAGQLGFADYFAALHRAHPACGRSRSVFGGLWTDRTDAAAVLKGKIAIGQIAPEAGATIGEMIHLGIALLADTGTAGLGDATVDAIATLIETPSLLAVLRAVFDDNPVVVDATRCDGDTALVQPSAEHQLPSAAECLVLVTPAAERDVAVDIVRDGHLLPEFTPGGVSRWGSGRAHAAVEIAAGRQGLMSRYDVPAGTVAIIGPGAIYRLRCGEGAAGVRMVCTPSRAMPMALAAQDNRREAARPSGVRLCI